ncbi:hypothetical protein FB567DRAFT_619471 [Paraphoma chrysanthemicola]|uniref:Uncharacterized protein n=1 Tax=Paraphoma chrysanthemicola TaxID=798071 RepID=A0A8K0RAQ5_9PLEO|nr:hypothetical protein FB567DRAFT_619471 [Paraphoma chrysanthemicola]
MALKLPAPPAVRPTSQKSNVQPTRTYRGGSWRTRRRDALREREITNSKQAQAQYQSEEQNENEDSSEDDTKTTLGGTAPEIHVPTEAAEEQSDQDDFGYDTWYPSDAAAEHVDDENEENEDQEEYFWLELGFDTKQDWLDDAAQNDDRYEDEFWAGWERVLAFRASQPLLAPDEDLWEEDILPLAESAPPLYECAIDPDDGLSEHYKARFGPATSRLATEIKGLMCRMASCHSNFLNRHIEALESDPTNAVAISHNLLSCLEKEYQDGLRGVVPEEEIQLRTVSVLFHMLQHALNSAQNCAPSHIAEFITKWTAVTLERHALHTYDVSPPPYEQRDDVFADRLLRGLIPLSDQQLVAYIYPESPVAQPTPIELYSAAVSAVVPVQDAKLTHDPMNPSNVGYHDTPRNVQTSPPDRSASRKRTSPRSNNNAPRAVSLSAARVTPILSSSRRNLDLDHAETSFVRHTPIHADARMKRSLGDACDENEEEGCSARKRRRG